VKLAMSSWGEDIAKYKASKGRVPWKPAQQKKVIHVTKHAKSREDRQYDPIVAKFRDPSLESHYRSEEKNAVATQVQAAADHALQYTQTFNIVNHKPNVKAMQLKKNAEPLPKKRVPATRVAYNIISNKGFQQHHHLPPDQRPQEPKEKEQQTVDRRHLDFDIVTNKYVQGHDAKDAMDKMASKQLADDRFWKTHNYNLVEGKFYDGSKEADYQNMMKGREKVQGQAQLNAQPRSIKYSEGAMYDLISNSTKDQKKLGEVSALGNRALKSKKRHQVEANLRQRALDSDKLYTQRTQNRMATHTARRTQEFNVINNTATPRSARGSGGGGSAWDRLSAR